LAIFTAIRRATAECTPGAATNSKAARGTSAALLSRPVEAGVIRKVYKIHVVIVGPIGYRDAQPDGASIARLSRPSMGANESMQVVFF
jgi:hypothetical protein